MKDQSNTLNTAELSSKAELIYELVHVSSINLVLTETLSKSKKNKTIAVSQRATFK